MTKTIVVNLGPVDGIAFGHGRCFIINQEEIAVFRSRDGEISAIENKCPHLKGPLSDGIVGDGKVVCPLHGHKFDLKTGKGSQGHECVRVFSTWVKDGDIILQYSSSMMIDGELKKQIWFNGV